ncbi:MAG: lipoprotein-releasing ABC transporter permease subunit [Pseudomonadales bacterium]|nr:lipoprotein-releasing ABC transporter permease subunit [Pseudomonadales bacterium]
MSEPQASLQNFPISRFIALRYVSVGKRSQLVSFMSAIAIFGLALGVAILITVLSVMNGFDREMRDNILGIVPHVTVYSEENLNADNWAEVATAVDGHPLVFAAAPVIQSVGVVATDNGNKGVLVNGIDAQSEDDISVIGRFMQAGDLSRLGESRWGMVIGHSLAEQLGVDVGDDVLLYSPNISINPLTPLATYRRFEVAGIFRVGTQQLDSELVMINIAAARALFRLRTPFNGLRIKANDPLQADGLARELDSELPPGVSLDSWTRQLGAIYNNIQFSRGIISFMLWLLIAVAAFNLVVSLIMIVRDKRADIAILRTLGASPRFIGRIFLWQGSLIGLIGISIGVLLGIIGSLQVSNLAAWIESRFGVQLLNPDVYPIDFLPSEIALGDILTVVIGVLLLSIVATIYPARRAASIQPAQALRAE